MGPFGNSGLLQRLSKPVVAQGPDVGPPESKDENHVRGPRPHAPYGRKPQGDLVVGEVRERRLVDFACGKAQGKIIQGLRFRARKSLRTQPLGTERGKLLGKDLAAGAASGRKNPARELERGGVAHLLAAHRTHNAAHEVACGEKRFAAAAGKRNELREFRVSRKRLKRPLPPGDRLRGGRVLSRILSHVGILGHQLRHQARRQVEPCGPSSTTIPMAVSVLRISSARAQLRAFLASTRSATSASICASLRSLVAPLRNCSGSI